MNNKLISTLILAAILSANASGRNDGYIVCGSGWDRLAIIEKETKEITWEHPLEKGWECNSADITEDGHILFSYRKGCRLVSKDHKTVWDITVPPGCEAQTAEVLEDGNMLIAWTGHPAVIMEVSPEGKTISRTEYETGIENPHSQFRQVTKARNGNYLIPLMSRMEIHEVDTGGETVRVFKISGKPFCLEPTGRNRYLVAGGDNHLIEELDIRNGKVHVVAKDSIGDIKLYFVAGLHYDRKAKSLTICNWQGHDTETSAKRNDPLAFTVTRKGEVVWSLNDKEKFGRISSINPIPEN